MPTCIVDLRPEIHPRLHGCSLAEARPPGARMGGWPDLGMPAPGHRNGARTRIPCRGSGARQQGHAHRGEESPMGFAGIGGPRVTG